MQWIALILGAAGSVVSVAQSRWCYVIWTFPNVYWSWYNWHNGERIQSLVFVLMFWTCLIGWLAWGRAKRTVEWCERCGCNDRILRNRGDKS